MLTATAPRLPPMIHNNRFGSGKTGEIETGQAVPLEQLPADGGSGEDSFVFRQIL